MQVRTLKLCHKFLKCIGHVMLFYYDKTIHSAQNEYIHTSEYIYTHIYIYTERDTIHILI